MSQHETATEESLSYDSIRAIEWKDDHLILLDQRKLPHSEQYIHLYNADDTADAITKMVVRGAPAIGITAAYGLVMAARRCFKQYPKDWRVRLEVDRDTLLSSRPTAVNLRWALDFMCNAIDADDPDPIPKLLAMAQQIHADDIAANHHMGKLGAELIKPGNAVITHCNTGSLATGGYGTALGVIRSAFADGRIHKVFADETRPWWQGARLTAWELVKDGIPVDLMCEGAAAHLMKSGDVSCVIVGSDRIAANGDVANKIGTYSLAVNAYYHDIPFMVVAPTSTIDMDTADGAGIPIEERAPEEVLNVGNQRVAALQAGAWNPAFDVTPANLVSMIVTEKGVVENPTTAKIAQLMAS